MGSERLTGSAAIETLISYWLMTSAGFLVFSANCPPNYSTWKKTFAAKINTEYMGYYDENLSGQPTR